MNCSRCPNGQLMPSRCPKAEQRGDRVAVVTDVPVLQCSSCGEIYYDEEVALILDGLLAEMLDRVRVGVRTFPKLAGR